MLTFQLSEKPTWVMNERLKEMQNSPRADLDSLSEDALSKIKNRDFLRIKKEQRLQYLTRPSMKSEEIEEWKQVTFRFRFNNDPQINSDLYLQTTAWQVFSKEIRSLELGGVEWKRNWLEWEFFATNGQRLIIRDWTTVQVKKKLSPREVEELEKSSIDAVKEWKDTPNYKIILEAQKRGISPKIANLLIVPQVTRAQWVDTDIAIEEILTELERTKDYFADDFWQNASWENNELSKKFIAYYLGQGHLNEEEKQAVSKELWINEEDLKNYTRKARILSLSGFRWMEELSEEERKSLADIPTEKIEEWKKEQFGKQFPPWSKEAQQLFTLAGLSMNPPLQVEEAKKWATNSWLHEILGHESRWIVWIANYTLRDEGIDGKSMKERSLKRDDLAGEQLARKEFWVISTAVWLWQLTMSNEKFLPHWRKSIWIPLEEAIWMLQYIRSGYGNPQVAYTMYWKSGWYNHPSRWQLYKWFEEGY